MGVDFLQQYDHAYTRTDALREWCNKNADHPSTPLRREVLAKAQQALRAGDINYVTNILDEALSGDSTQLRTWLEKGPRYKNHFEALQAVGIISRSSENIVASKSRILTPDGDGHVTLTVPKNMTSQEAYDLTQIGQELLQNVGMAFYGWDASIQDHFDNDAAIIPGQRDQIEGFHPISPGYQPEKTISSKTYNSAAYKDQYGSFLEQISKVQEQLETIGVQIPYYADSAGMIDVRAALTPLLASIKQLRETCDDIIQYLPADKSTPVPVPPRVSPSTTAPIVAPVSKTQASTNTGSEAGSPHTVAAALGATEEFLGKNRVWRSSKPQAQAFFRNLSTLRSQVQGVDFVQTEAGIGKPGVAEVNRFLKDKGFTIQLKSDGVQPSDVSAAAVMDIKVTWRDKGEARNNRLSTGSKKEVPGVSISSIQTASHSSGHDYPIIQVPTQNGFDVYMTRYDGALSEDPMALSQITSGIMNGITHEETIKGAWFPMVDFEERGTLSWLLGASTTDAQNGGTATISQALAQYRLRMNEVGARAEAAVAVSTTKGMRGPRSVSIDGPFLVWFVKDGVTYFSAYIDEDSMKTPQM